MTGACFRHVHCQNQNPVAATKVCKLDIPVLASCADWFKKQNKKKIFTSFIGGNNFISVAFFITVVKRLIANLNLISQIKNKKKRIWEWGVLNEGVGGIFFLFLLISYLWIYLDAGECCCTNFKHYLILQTSLLMLLRSEAHSTALAKRRWQRVHMCMSVRFQRGSRKSSVWARSDTSEQPKRPR